MNGVKLRRYKRKPLGNTGEDQKEGKKDVSIKITHGYRNGKYLISKCILVSSIIFLTAEDKTEKVVPVCRLNDVGSPQLH